jgi:hypothetical protein
MLTFIFCALFATALEGEWSSFRGDGGVFPPSRPSAFVSDDENCLANTTDRLRAIEPGRLRRKIFVTSVDSPEKEARHYPLLRCEDRQPSSGAPKSRLAERSFQRHGQPYFPSRVSMPCRLRLF